MWKIRSQPARPRLPGMGLPASGMAKNELLSRLADLRVDDKDWRSGRVFSLVFHAGDDVDEVAREASAMFLAENALNPLAFPSVGRMQQDVVDITAACSTAATRPPAS